MTTFLEKIYIYIYIYIYRFYIYIYIRTSVYGHLAVTVTPGQSRMISIVKYRTLIPLIRSPRYSGIRSVTRSMGVSGEQVHGSEW